ncbi:MAG TPA: type VI secretion system tip protein TssI/VgrG [Sandaracinaceae bacterium LLY-WYZ-13_1]|nr:type VI secretion system tip protein TssI/VgrG [Sandaracinaceae bacterium LLY-WYZ-13_1]
MLESLRVHFESAGFPGVEIHPDSYVLLEAIDEPYLAEVEVSLDDPDADLAAFLGEDCVLSFERQPDLMRRVCGIVITVTERDVVATDRVSARLVIAPAAWMLSKRRDTRIFQDMTVPEILDEVLCGALGDYGREARQELDGSYAKREYCVQHQESDLDFAHRLMQAEGIHYAFDHEGEVEVMVLRDRNEAYPQLPTAPEGGAVEFRPDDLVVRHTEPVHFVIDQRKQTTTSVVVGDWDWTRTDMPFSAEARGQDELGADRESYEHGLARSVNIHSYSGGSYGDTDVARQVELREEAHTVDGRTIVGVGRVSGMTPGTTFDLTGHPMPGLDGTYLITRVRHASQPAEAVLRLETDGREGYHNRFEAIPIDVPHRPKRRTRRPFVPSIQTAVVTGPSGEEIHVDEHGRIKVQFHWDRVGQNDERSSCWIRVQQAWAGAGWGFWYVPRIGMEVVVQFVDGDPDRPLVTGCVYNGSNALPYPQPDEKTKSTMKSNSSLGGGGFNEFRYEDAAGSEEIYTHAQKDYNEVVENDHTTHVKHDQTNTVDNDQTQEIGNDQTETVHNNQQMTVDGNRKVHVKGNFDETVDGTETRTTTGDVTETFEANETRDISSNVTETISGNEKRTISGNQTETISASHTLTVGGNQERSITGSLTESVTAAITTTTPASYDITASAGFNVTTPAAITFAAPGGVTVAAPGGITWTDSYRQWLGKQHFTFTPFNSSTWLMKVEVCAVAFCMFGLKADATVITVENLPLEQENRGGKIKNTGADIWQRTRLSFVGWRNEG